MKTPLIFAITLVCQMTVSAQEASEKITYADQIRPMLENKCFSCHNPDKKKGDLDLTSFSGAMAGGGSGSVVNAGDPDGSKLILSVLKKEEPYMPPEGTPLGSKDIEILSKWIQGGLLETASSVAKKAAPKANLTLVGTPTGKPEGPPPVPEHVLLEPVIVAPRGTVVTALAASPWAPLVAVSGAKQALIYDADTHSLAGVYPYPEGYIRSLKFSQNGALLVAGGGRGGKSGNAVVWDVKTGRRVTEVGHEFDQVMAADISPNQAMIAFGSPSKKVKCFNASTGEELYIIKKHTEWVLQVAFSPDGVLLATADRNGGIIISEAANGGEFYTLDGHKASCTGLAWRSDSNVLASCSEDGKIAVWEMQNGKLVKSWDAHGGGCEGVSFTPDGRIVSCGRDGLARIWDLDGKKLAESKASPDILTKTAGLSDSKTVAIGDWQGNVRFCRADNFEELGVVSSNPPPLAQRIADSERLANEFAAQATASEASMKKVDEALHAQEAILADTKKKAADLEATRAGLDAELKESPAKVATQTKAVQDAQQKRAAQADTVGKYEQATAQIKQLEASLASLNADKAKIIAPEQAPQRADLDKKIADQTTQLDGLKKANTVAPPALAAFDKALKDAQDQLMALNSATSGKQKELETATKAIAALPKAMADAEKQVADAHAAVDAEQKKLADVRSRLAWVQKQPTFLRAAQFNVAVLSESEKLEKLDGDVKGMQEAVKDMDAAKTAATERIESGKKTVAEAAAKLPLLDAEVAKLKNDLPAFEKSLEPLKQEEAQVAAKLDGQKKALAAKQAELAAATQDKDQQIAAAQRAVADFNQQTTALQKQLGEVNGKLDAPQKLSDTKKLDLAKVTAELEPLSKPLPDLQKSFDQADAKFTAASQAYKFNAGDPNIKTAFASAKQEHDAAQTALTQAKAAVQSRQQIQAALGKDLTAIEKIATPLRDQSHNITTQLDVLKKSLADKQAAMAAVEKDYAANVQPLNAAIAQIQGALDPLEKQVAAAHDKIASATKTLEARQAELAKAQFDLAAAQQAQVAAQKTIETSTKEIADKEKALGDTKTELAKNEPLLEPQRAKVKQMTDRYLTMLPK